MKTIKKISPIRMFAEARSKSFASLLYIGLPLFVIASLAIAYNGFFKTGSTGDGLMGLLCFSLFAVCGYFLLNGGSYTPQKTFFLYRLTKEGLIKYCKWGALFYVLFCAFILIIDPHIFLKCCAGGFISLIVIIYYMYKSIQVHEDVDYVANMQLADLIGLEVDEKINASYQNFDSSENSIVQKNSNILLVSNRKIFFAFYDGNNWFTTIKKLEEIKKIGCMNYGDDGSSTYLKLVFTDDTTIGLRLNLYDKLTSNPNLFIKRFLETVDAYLLGYSISNRSSRRRISVDITSQVQHELSQPSDTIETTKMEAPVTRQIDISDSIINEIKQGIIVEPGRTIEF